jgi:large subunit ribosomal protein L1
MRCNAVGWFVVCQLTSAKFRSYIRAFEVGRPGHIPKYECHVKFKTRRSGRVMRNQMRLPHSVKTDIKICVICPPDSPAAKQAREAGATLVGEEEVFDIVKSGKIDFQRCIAHPDSLPKVAKAGLPKILGPRGLMPNVKLGTVVENVGSAVRKLLGGSVYRERQGVVRMAVGQLKFTPEQLRDNIRAFLGSLKKDAANLSEEISKEINEVVSISCARV